VLPGIGGTLFAPSFLERRLPSLVDHVSLPARGAVRDALAAWWRRTRAECGPATSVRALADTAAARLTAVLGAGLEGRRALDDALWLARAVHGQVSVPIAILPWQAPLDRARRDALRAALVERSRWVFVFNGPTLRLADAGASSTRRHLDVALGMAADSEASAWCVRAIAATLFEPSGEGVRLDAVVAAADDEGRRVCAGLRDGVVAALEHLCDGLAGGRRGAPLEAVYEEAQTAVYRMLFLSFVEARRLTPSWHPTFRKGYTIAALRAQLEAGRTAGLWESFQAISRLAHDGCDAGDLRVAALNGRLFAPTRAPMLDRRRLSDERMAGALDSLSFTASSGRRERISYAELGVEEIGGVYESLLDHEPTWTTSRVGAARPGRHTSPSRRIALARTAGVRRKETGTYYTPVPLARYLVREALRPLVHGAAAERILALRIVDPAMGSGAFLVAACQYLADAYEAALVRDGVVAAGDVTDDARASYRRLVAQRCLYGVDANPAAVQLARVSLWLTTLAAGRPLGFLDHRLRCGDSLVGATLTDVLTRRPAARGSRPHPAQAPLFTHDDWQAAQRRVLPVRRRIEDEPDDSALVVRRKESALADLAPDLAPWREVADLWCARWADGAPASEAEFDALARHLVSGQGPLSPAVAGRAVGRVRRLAEADRWLHWTLEFPEVFCDERGREHGGGFDAVIGNPPWEMLRADAGRESVGRAARTVRFAREAGVYHARSRGHANEYQLFVERAVRLARPGGRIGLVVPHGLAADQGAAALRHLLLRECDTDAIVGFENRRGVFPIHRSMRFLLVTATRGGRTGEVRCVFGLQDPAVLDGLSERSRRDALPVAFTPELLERLSGPDLAIPDVRTPADLALAERLCALHPRLPDAAGWGARFARELNATDDRGHFTADPSALPVIDGRHVSPFRVDVGAAERRIARSAAARLLDEPATFGRTRLAFRDVASSTNRTTLIAALVPSGCVTTHTLFCLRSRLTIEDQRVLAALLNGYVANWLVRLRVSSHVSLAILRTLPVPCVRASSALGWRLAGAAQLLEEGRADPVAVEAELQALGAIAYGVSEDEFTRLLESFPLVEPDARERARQAFIRESRG
jgi:hypothetical protein